MNQHRHLSLAEAEDGRGLEIKDPRDALHLQEMVPRPERAELIGAAHPRALRHRRRIGALKTAL